MSDAASALVRRRMGRVRSFALSPVRRVADALVTGAPIDWSAAERLAETPQDLLVTRQLRLVAALAADPSHDALTIPRRFRRPTLASLRDGVMRALATVTRRGRAPGRDHDTDLARVATAMSRARTPREIASTMAHGLRETLGTGIVAVVGRTEEAWMPLVGPSVPLPIDSGLTALIEGADVPVRVAPGTPLFGLLPAADRQRLASAGIEAVVRLAAGDGRTIAGLLIGRPAGPRRYKRRDLAFAAAVAATAALALDACARSGRGVGARAIDEELAFECGACGRVDNEAGVCRCGAPRQLAALPLQLSGKFLLERRLGHGGMGVVYLAVDRFLGRLVALKTLPLLSPAGVAALHAEAKAMADVGHPSVAVVYGLEVWKDTPVLVVEYLGGGTMARRLARGPLPLREALRVGIALADTLADLHACGWLHRDIKPSNIGLARDGTVKLLDFGLARMTVERSAHTYGEGEASDWTRPGRRPSPMAGTPLYLSPEALEGQPASEATDVWSLALVVFEMITGTHPWRATTLEEVMGQVRRTEPLDVRAWAPATPARLAEVLAAALHPDLASRVTRAGDFACALRTAGADLHD